MIRLGVVVNTGKGDKPSKTEAVYFSSKTRIQSWIKNYKNNIIQDSTLPLIDKETSKKVDFL